MNKKKVLISVDKMSKKFCKDLKFNMWYGILDIVYAVFGMTMDRSSLRKKEFWALDKINLDLFEGEVTALLGTNGSGKTTLIRILSEIYKYDQGALEYNDSVKRIVSVFAVKSGMQNSLTGRENVYLKSAFYGMTKSEVEEKMEFIIDFSGIKKFIDTPMGSYSSGMRTRLAMSIAISVNTDILFIDEGFSFSDPGFKQRCLDHLAVTYKKDGKALIFATHQIGRIQDFADRVVLMDQGKILDVTYDVEKGIVSYLKMCS